MPKPLEKTQKKVSNKKVDKCKKCEEDILYIFNEIKDMKKDLNKVLIRMGL